MTSHERTASGYYARQQVSSATLHRAILSNENLVRSGEVINNKNLNLDCAEAGVTEDLDLSFASAADLREYLDTHPRIRFIELEFADASGNSHRCTYNVQYVTVERLTSGFAFDASSIPLMEKINNSDMAMLPDLTTCHLDPFATYPTLRIICSVVQSNGDPYEKCPRSILQGAIKQIARIKVDGNEPIADKLMIGPELEFFVFDSVRYCVEPQQMSFAIDGEEAYWNYNTSGSTSGNGLMGHRANLKQGYMTTKPTDRLTDLRSEALLHMEQLGIITEKHHHEVATCQMEINVSSGEVLKMADMVTTTKYVVKICAARRRMTATFMPKPLACDNGSGMHFNMSLWKGSTNLFYDPKSDFHNLSELGFKYMSGVLHHCLSLLAFCCPTYNSYRRLVPQFEAPVHVTYSAGNRSCGIRIPTLTTPNSTRIEFRMPDASCSPYLAFAAVLLAGLDGIENNYPLPPQGVGDLFDPENVLTQKLKRAPKNLEGALAALEEDHDYLTKNNVFTEEFISSYLKYKREEIDSLACCPHPKEFMLYYGC